MNKNKKSLHLLPLIFLLAYVSVVAASVIFSSLYYTQKRDADESIYKSSQTERVQQLKQRIDQSFADVITGLNILEAHKELEKYMIDGNSENLANLADEFLAYSNNKGIHDQIRILDLEGKEVVRVNYNDGAPSIVPQEKLTDKGGRYYFTDSIKLEEGEVFVSPFDLNIENGQIESPRKPMIRVATPIFHNGEKRGILLVNYLGQELLNSLGAFSRQDGSQVQLLNDDGYWLLGDSQDQEWGFMYEDKLDLTMAASNNDLWARIRAASFSQFKTDTGLYTVATLNPFKLAQASSTGTYLPYSESLEDLSPFNYKWHLVSYVPGDVIFATSDELKSIFILMNAFVIIVFGAGMWALYLNTRKRLVVESKILKLNDVLQMTNRILRHDLANIFTAIKLCKQMYDEDEGKENLDEIGLATTEGIDLIKGMQELDEFTATDNEARSYKLSEVFQDIIKRNSDVTISVTGDATVMADSALKVVFSNLINNSRRHGDAKNVEVKIISAQNGVEIQIGDDGTGIPEDIREDIFDEGFKSGKKGNTGLGLYIIKKTIERYGGEITVTENKPKGALFIIRL